MKVATAEELVAEAAWVVVAGTAVEECSQPLAEPDADAVAEATLVVTEAEVADSDADVDADALALALEDEPLELLKAAIPWFKASMMG